MTATPRTYYVPTCGRSASLSALQRGWVVKFGRHGRLEGGGGSLTIVLCGQHNMRDIATMSICDKNRRFAMQITHRCGGLGKSDAALESAAENTLLIRI